MLKYHNFDIVCQEVPDEVSIAINITGCPNRCPGCHSQWLWKDAGTPLSFSELDALIDCYECAVTCVCFMGGDQAPEEVQDLARHVHVRYPNLRLAWYSGLTDIPSVINPTTFNFIKVGPYQAFRGALDSKNTNQRFYAILPNGNKEDLTYRFWKKEVPATPLEPVNNESLDNTTSAPLTAPEPNELPGAVTMQI